MAMYDGVISIVYDSSKAGSDKRSVSDSVLSLELFRLDDGDGVKMKYMTFLMTSLVNSSVAFKLISMLLLFGITSVSSE